MKISGLSIVVPVYDSQDSLPELASRIQRVLGKHGIAFEIVFVNDASTDRSWDAIQSLASMHENVRGLDLAVNSGQHRALWSGILAATHPFVLTMDDDGQHQPEFIPLLIEKMEHADVDVVYGVFDKRTQTRMERLGTLSLDIVLTLLFAKPSRLPLSSFRLFNERTIAHLTESLRFGSPSLHVHALKATDRIGHVVVPRDRRRSGRSGHRLWTRAVIIIKIAGWGVMRLLRLERMAWARNEPPMIKNTVP